MAPCPSGAFDVGYFLGVELERIRTWIIWSCVAWQADKSELSCRDSRSTVLVQYVLHGNCQLYATRVLTYDISRP
jgi:hypothetical protein